MPSIAITERSLYIIQVTPPYTFSIIQPNMDLLGFNSTQIISTSATSDNPINFLPHKMLYVHLKQIKNNFNYSNGNKSDVLARISITEDNFGTLVQHKFERPYVNILDNTTISSLELTITDEISVDSLSIDCKVLQAVTKCWNMAFRWIFGLRKYDSTRLLLKSCNTMSAKSSSSA
jgi:hypothetical protein